MLHVYNCTGTVLVPVARYQLVQYEAPTKAVRAVRGRVLEPSVLVETLSCGRKNSLSLKSNGFSFGGVFDNESPIKIVNPINISNPFGSRPGLNGLYASLNPAAYIS